MAFNFDKNDQNWIKETQEWGRLSGWGENGSEHESLEYGYQEQICCNFMILLPNKKLSVKQEKVKSYDNIDIYMTGIILIKIILNEIWHICQ